MTFAELFIHGQEELISSSMETIMLFLPKDIPIDTESSKYLFYLLAAGIITVPAGAHFSMRHLPSYCLIHSLSGSGCFRTQEHVITLPPGTLFFADCRCSHNISAITAWEYEAIYFDGAALPFYYDRLRRQEALFLTHSSNTLITSVESISSMKNLSSICGRMSQSSSPPIDVFLTHKLLTDVLTNMIQNTGKNDTASVPSYLALIRKEFDNNYFMNFTLEQLEGRFQVNKYRICKEFKHYYYLSPIQYLHNIRIRNAQVLLRDTMLKIHEIGYQVGYENANHFIHHFKKITGTTPAVYRSKEGGVLP